MKVALGLDESEANAPVASEAYAAGDTVKVEYDGVDFVYFHNGVELSRESGRRLVGDPRNLRAAIVLYTESTAVAGVQVGNSALPQGAKCAYARVGNGTTCDAPVFSEPGAPPFTSLSDAAAHACSALCDVDATCSAFSVYP